MGAGESALENSAFEKSYPKIIDVYVRPDPNESFVDPPGLTNVLELFNEGPDSFKIELEHRTVIYSVKGRGESGEGYIHLIYERAA